MQFNRNINNVKKKKNRNKLEFGRALNPYANVTRLSELTPWNLNFLVFVAVRSSADDLVKDPQELAQSIQIGSGWVWLNMANNLVRQKVQNRELQQITGVYFRI